MQANERKTGIFRKKKNGKTIPSFSLHFAAYLLSKLSQQVQCSALQSQVLPTWIFFKVQ
jgi:hypothetical protein